MKENKASIRRVSQEKGWPQAGSRPGRGEEIRSRAATPKVSVSAAVSRVKGLEGNAKALLKLGGTACAYHAPWHIFARGVFIVRAILPELEGKTKWISGKI